MENYSLIRSTSCSCSTCCFGLGFQLEILQDFIKISSALIKDILLRAHSQWVAGPGRRVQVWAVGHGRAPHPAHPHPGKSPPPPAPLCRPHSAQNQLARAGPPAGGRATRSQARRRMDRANPRRARGTEHGTGAGDAEGHEPPGTALPAPCSRTASSSRATPTQGGGAYAGGAQVQPHPTDTRRGPQAQPDRARGTQ